MNPTAPIFATGTRVAGAVLVLGYVSGLVPGAVVSLAGGLALMTFGRALLLDRRGTSVAGAALAIAAGALGVAGLRWGTLSLEELVGAQSVLGPTILVEPEEIAIAAGAALVAALVAVAVWSTEPVATEKTSIVWSRVEAILAVAAAVLVFAAPATGGGLGELVSEPVELAPAAGALMGGVAAVFLAPRLFRSPRVRWVLLALSGAAVIASAAVMASNV